MRVVLHAPANGVWALQHVRTLLSDESLELEVLSIVAHADAVDLLPFVG